MDRKAATLFAVALACATASVCLIAHAGRVAVECWQGRGK